MKFTFTFLVAYLLLFCSRQLTAEQKFKVIKDLSYKEGDVSDYETERCKLDLYLPKDGVKDFATIVWFHGGGLKNGDKAGDIAVSFAGRFANKGIAVASVNYRLYPKVKYPAYIDDAAAAVAFVHNSIARHGGSPKKVFISGHSAGGYLTAMVGSDSRFLEKYGLGKGDLAGLMPVAGQMVTHSTVREERGIPKTRPVIDEAAPAFHVAQDLASFLCIVGSEDLPARAEENRYFVAAMTAAGHKDVIYLEVADRNHGTIASRIAESKDEVAEAMVEFIDRLTP